MELNQLYQFVLVLFMVGLMVGLSVIAFDKMTSSVGATYTTSSNTFTWAMRNMTSSVAEIPNTWLSLIVTIVILAIIIVIVLRSFGGGRQ